MQIKRFLMGVGVVFLFAGALYFADKGPNPEEGRVVVGITDAAASIESVKAINIKIDKVEIESLSDGWVTIASSPKQYDLLKLRDSGDIILHARTSIPAGIYRQIKLTVGKVVIEANGSVRDAKMPVNQINIMSKIVVNKGRTSTVVVDFLADKSLHVTGIGEFVFAPVMDIESRSDANVETGSGGAITIIGGKTESDLNLGMNENGQIKTNFALSQNARIDIVGGALKIMTDGEGEPALKISAKSAVDAAMMGGYVDTALSIKFAQKDGKSAWRVYGEKALAPQTIYVDAVTGAIISVE